MRIKIGVAGLIGVATIVWAGAALAHHSFAQEFDSTKTLRLEGTVTKFE